MWRMEHYRLSMKPTAYSPDVIQTHAISEIMGKRNYDCPLNLKTLNLKIKALSNIYGYKEKKKQSQNRHAE